MGRTKCKTKFSFVIDAGPSAGMNSGTWVVWANREDTYIAATHLGNKWKVSLHGDIAWRLAVPKESRSDPPLLPAGHDRAPWKFAPTSFVDGRRLAFVIAVTRAAMLPHAQIAVDATQVGVQDRWDVVHLAKIWMTEPGYELDREWNLVGDALPLASLGSTDNGSPSPRKWGLTCGNMALAA
jgi:hypothetical protein